MLLIIILLIILILISSMMFLLLCILRVPRMCLLILRVISLSPFFVL